MKTTTELTEPLQNLSSIVKQLDEIHRLIGESEFKKKIDEEALEKQLRGDPDDQKTLNQINALNIKLSMRPRVIQNLREQLPPLLTGLPAIRTKLFTALDALQRAVQSTLFQEIEAVLAPYFDERVFRKIIEPHIGPGSQDLRLGECVASAVKHADFSIRLGELKLIYPTECVNESHARQMLSWAREIAKVEEDWVARQADVSRPMAQAS